VLCVVTYGDGQNTGWGGGSLMLSQACDQLVKLLTEEEIKFYQRAKVTDVLLGDNNMKYF
jgi:hypothetical protein